MSDNPIKIFPLPSIRLFEQSERKRLAYWREKLFKRKNQVNNIPSEDQQSIESSEEKGVDDAVREHAKKIEGDKQVLEDMVINSNRILTKVDSVFLWDFFPTTICVEDTRVTIIYRQLFSSQVYSVDIKDISNILFEQGFFFATIIIISNTFTQSHMRIGTLKKSDAIFVRRLLEGLRMFIKHDIDTSSYEVEALVNKLKELSTTEIVT